MYSLYVRMKGPEGTLPPQHGSIACNALARGRLLWPTGLLADVCISACDSDSDKSACQDNCKTPKGFVYGSRRGACDEGLYTHLAHAIDNTRNMDG